jgi:Asp-tRNA(Asn)/Glu-tRNA(Gln) amidotransferase B subunit
MSEEILKVLEMVRDGKISAEDGEKLLSAMGTEAPAKKLGKKNSMLRVRVDVKDPDKKEQARVNVNVPLALAKKAVGLMNFIPKDAKKELAEQGIDLDEINLKELIELFEDGEISEELVNVDAGDDTQGAKVRVYVD